jgi:hypothetical protein
MNKVTTALLNNTPFKSNISNKGGMKCTVRTFIDLTRIGSPEAST